MTRRLLAAVATALLLAGCSGPGTTPAAADNPRPLTTDEAERIALVRFANHQRGRGAVIGVIPSAGRNLHLNARVDWRDRRGYGTVHATEPTGERIGYLLQWTSSAIAVAHEWAGGLPDQPPATVEWKSRPPAPRHNTVDAALLMTLDLATDRPENAQSLARSDARWLRSERLGNGHLMVVAGPGPATDNTRRDRVRYWIDGGGALRRVTAPVGGNGDVITLDLPDQDSPEVPPFTWR
ncbi:hypothetical protein [Saccharothrix obliqua]|uniref:hypothetical protein n=1 Tax=Saccharothrix obliqua TaxID=2861747 RepID=UPI001C5EA8B6|nr:hypothetical protein [Saccharothrix obliqua]MBW4717184.1 hypothetical protein [Saccharothrix obliqua]